MLTTQVADRVHRLEHAHVNCYLVEEGGRLTLVDAGLPAMWSLLQTALRELDHDVRDIAAIALTHAHFDHVGFAARAQRELRVPIWVHADDAYLAAHPYRYSHERLRSMYPLRYPRAIPILATMARAGALTVKGVRGVRTYPLEGGAGTLDVPGAPRVVLTPGHTFGHCALHLPDRDVVISGDALVTLDPYTGRTGPHIVAGAATANSSRALASLDALAATGASVVLPGHGEPWTGGAVEAVALARREGAA
jgi:glyoxylase-like metal-dependent hydrolase (beta-lactamase superfamily II)